MKVNIKGNPFYKPGDNYTFMECAFLYIRRCALKKKRLSNILNIDATDEGFSRNASRALNNTSTFLFKTLINEDIIIRSFIKEKLFIALGLLQVNFV